VTIHCLAGRVSISDTYDVSCLSIYFHNAYCAHPASYKILVCGKLCRGDSPLHVARSGNTRSITAKPCTDRPTCDPWLGILARLVGFENSDAR